ncbi:MAG: hypothetical protein F6K09_36085, partial [Merismopedia sp. SIO2A8]|nr:hypothetical protein [Merismopedia sp. SIO2A8]
GGGQLAAWVDTARALDSYLLFDEFYSNYIWDAAASAHGSVSAAAHVENVDDREAGRSPVGKPTLYL